MVVVVEVDGVKRPSILLCSRKLWNGVEVEIKEVKYESSRHFRNTALTLPLPLRSIKDTPALMPSQCDPHTF